MTPLFLAALLLLLSTFTIGEVHVNVDITTLVTVTCNPTSKSCSSQLNKNSPLLHKKQGYYAPPLSYQQPSSKSFSNGLVHNF